MSLLVIILALLNAFLLWRLYQTRRVISQLLEAAGHSRQMLLERSGPLITGFKLDRLVRAFNGLIAEKADVTDTGQSYLEQIRTTLGSLREVVVMVDHRNIIRVANPAMAELIQSDEPTVGRRLDRFIHGTTFQQYLDGVQAGGGGQRKEIEVEINGKKRWLEVIATVLRENPQKEGPYTLFFFHDITRQKELEKMRTDFVANVSHELRTPVTIIKGFAETLIEDDAILGREEKLRFLKKIRTHAERQHNLIQDLLLLSRLESTEMVLQKERLSISKFLKEMVETWEPVLEEGGQVIRQEYAEGYDEIDGDPLRLTQVLSNLLENALRHARGFTEIRVATQLLDGIIRITVADNGPGIPEKDLPLVFQRFYRVDKGRSRESGGTGLGLSIVKHIVVQHKGKIEAKRGSKKGTIIEITLPLAPANTDGREGPVDPQ